jgi:hypothetical protein
MEQLMGNSVARDEERQKYRIVFAAEWAIWEVRRIGRAMTRQFGLWIWGVLLCFVAGAVAAFIVRHETASAIVLEYQLQEKTNAQSALVKTVSINSNGGRNRLKAFENLLLPHEDIPAALLALFRLAEAEGLTMQRGAYHLQIDTEGQFLRYQMTLPVKGDALAIQRFIRTALNEQPTLALDSIQFKRERIESTVVEARIHWILVARLPTYQAAFAPATTQNVDVMQ